MIDWLKFQFRLKHIPVLSGRVMKISPGGVIDWETPTGQQVEGSYSASVRVSTREVDSEGYGTLLEIDGNPVKLLQGHNVFGTGSVRQVAAAALMHVAPILGVPFLPEDLARVLAGEFELWRVDATLMFEFERGELAAQVMASLQEGATMRYRSRSNVVGDTLYFGQHSRRWALKVYPKGPEFRRGSVAYRRAVGDEAFSTLAAWADRCLRFEVVLRRLELQTRGLTMGSDWSAGDDVATVRSAVESLKMGALPGDVSELPPRIRALVGAWQAGHPAHTLCSRSAYYRALRLADAHGINLRLPCPMEPRTVPQFDFATARHVTVPTPFRGSVLHYDFESIRALRLVA